MATKKKTKKIVPSGIAKVQATFNNTIILLTDFDVSPIVYIVKG